MKKQTAVIRINQNTFEKYFCNLNQIYTTMQDKKTSFTQR